MMYVQCNDCLYGDRLDAQNLVVPLSGETGYRCEVHVGEPPQSVEATRVDANTIVCNTHRYGSHKL